MRKLIMSLMQLMLPLWIMAQADVSGKVIDAEENEPLVGVSVIIKDSCGKIIKFATTKADGSFSMQGPMIEGRILEAMIEILLRCANGGWYVHQWGRSSRRKHLPLQIFS